MLKIYTTNRPDTDKIYAQKHSIHGKIDVQANAAITKHFEDIADKFEDFFNGESANCYCIVIKNRFRYVPTVRCKDASCPIYDILTFQQDTNDTNHLDSIRNIRALINANPG